MGVVSIATRHQSDCMTILPAPNLQRRLPHGRHHVVWLVTGVATCECVLHW